MKAKINVRSHPALVFYWIGLGHIALLVLLISITLWNVGFYFINFWGIIIFWSISLAFVLPLFLPAYGARSLKKWGLIVNYIFLVFFIPVFMVFPLVMSWYIPHIEAVFSVFLLVGSGILIAVFDVFYLVWFIRNRRLFLSGRSTSEPP